MGTLQRLGPRGSICKKNILQPNCRPVLGSRLQQFEMTFPRLLHLLAHHPDFEMTHLSLVEISRSVRFVPRVFRIDHQHHNRYIKFYTLTVATAENISLIFHLAEKLKTIQDAESDQYSEACVFSFQIDCLINLHTVLSAYTP